ncbi:MAG TPA: hypothetical protein PLN52_14380 [Opitutaceae bacterium]|nr:hypothetical protein [Opitutaceae bacterium]
MKTMLKSLVIGWVPTLALLGAAAPSADTVAEPLTQVVAELCVKENPSAKDFARLAETTLDYARRKLQTREPTPASVIETALDAVNAGEKKDPKAAAWEKLREDLEALKEKPPETPPESQDKSQQQKDKNQENQGDQGDSESDKDDSSSQEGSKDGKSSDQGKQDGKQEQKDNTSSDPNADQQGQNQNEPQPGENAQKNSAFGDMKEKNPAEPQSAPEPGSEETQSVGGQHNKDLQPSAETQNPNLAIPLQKLEALRRQDSPAQLFRMIEGPAPANAKKGKDW